MPRKTCLYNNYDNYFHKSQVEFSRRKIEKFMATMTKFNDLLEKKYGAIRGAQTKLANDLEINQSTISYWVTGRNVPSPDLIRKMSRIFNTTESELRAVFGIEEMREFTPTLRATPLTDKNTISLPILADVPAGLPEFSESDVETFWDIPRWVFPGADFVVKCNGDSLEPKLHLGDYCVIRKTEQPIHGRAMVVKTEHGVCMKVINKLPDGKIQLCSTNKKYKPFTPKELRIVGLIIGSWSRQDKDNWLGAIEEIK